jgi:hypothetical protein
MSGIHRSWNLPTGFVYLRSVRFPSLSETSDKLDDGCFPTLTCYPAPNEFAVAGPNNKRLLRASCDHRQNQAEKPILFPWLMTQFVLGKVFSDLARLTTKIKLTAAETACQCQRLCDSWLKS